MAATAQTPDPCREVELVDLRGEEISKEAGEACLEALPNLSAAAQERHVDFYVTALPGYLTIEQNTALSKRLAPEPRRKMLSLITSSEAVRGNLDMEEAERLIERARKADDEVALAHLYYAKGVQIARDSGSNDDMEAALQQSLSFAISSNLREKVPSIYNALGVRAKRDGEVDVAIDLYRQAIEAYEGLGQFEKVGVALTNIGNIFSNIGGSREAVRFHSQAIESYKTYTPDDVYRIAGAYANLGLAHYNAEQFEKSAAAYFEAKRFNNRDPTDFLTPHLAMGHAEALYRLGETDAAIEMAEGAIPQMMEFRDPVEAASGLLWVAQHYMTVGETGRAEDSLKQARSIIEPNGGGIAELESRPGDVNLKIDYARLSGQLLTALGRPDEASPYLLAAMSLSDARFEAEKVEAVANTELLFDIRDRDRQLESLGRDALLSEARLRQSQLGFGLAVAIALLIGTLAYAAFRSYRMQKAMVKTRDVFLQEIHHRTGNNFQMMASLLRNEERTLAKLGTPQGASRNTANRIRAMALIHDYLYNSEGRELTHVQPDAFIVELLELLDESLGEPGIAIAHDITSTPVDISVATPLALLVCELVTNAHKHAFPDGKGSIDVRIVSETAGLKLTIVDDGRGFDFEKAREKDGSQGMQLIEDLVEQVGGRMAVTSNESGTAWTIDRIHPAIKPSSRATAERPSEVRDPATVEG